MNHYLIGKEDEQTMYQTLISGKLYAAVDAIAPQLPYHNMEHMVDVAQMCRHYVLREGLTNTDAMVLESAALLHDAIYIPGRKDNEEESVKIAEQTLTTFGYDPKTIDSISNLIMATKLPTSPKDIGEAIICDSDIDNLGREDFWEKAERVRLEAKIEKNQWYGTLLPKFLSGVKYYTKSAQEHRAKNVAEYLERLIKNDYQRYLWTVQ